MRARPEQSATAAARPESSAIEDRLRVASLKYEQQRRRMDRAELDRARAVLSARAAGMSTYQIARVLGVTQPRVMALAKWGAERGLAPRAEPEASATRGAPEPTPIGVLLARALEDPPARVVDELVSACPAAEPEASATDCRRLGCREPVGPGSPFCPDHARF